MDNRQIIKAFNNCRQLGIKTLAYNIVGLPFETPSKTIEAAIFSLNLSSEQKAIIAEKTTSLQSLRDMPCVVQQRR